MAENYPLVTSKGLAEKQRKTTVDFRDYASPNGVDCTAQLNQALVDAGPGGAVLVERDGPAGTDYVINGTVETAFTNQRVTGGHGDRYRVALKRTVAGSAPVIRVKHTGFVIDNIGIVGPGAPYGVDAQGTAIELLGDVNGNVDARIDRVNLQFISTGIRAHGRNVKVTNSVFSNNKIGFHYAGSTEYHTGALADRLYGYNIRDCEFHTIGNSGSDTAILFDPVGQSKHALIKGCTFDIGRGKHIVLNGDPTQKHYGFLISGNNHSYVDHDVYSFNNIKESSVSSFCIVGVDSGSRSSAAVQIINSENIQVASGTINKMGGSGFRVYTSTAIELSDIAMANMGRYGAGTGHGVSCGDDFTTVRLNNVSLDTVDGHGFRGNPASARLMNCSWTNTGLAAVNSTTAVDENKVVADGLAGKQRKYALDIRDFGAVGDGVTDDSAAFAAFAIAVRDSKKTVPYNLVSDKFGSQTVKLPEGDFLITEPGAFFGDEAETGRARGVMWEGAGPGLTRIIFKPVEAATFMTNKFWQRLVFRDLSFMAATPGCTFFASNGDSAAQDFRWDNCEWVKWKDVFYLEGVNHNSEWRFTGCRTSNLNDDGCFLKIPSGGSDQNVNYWFYGFAHWSTDAPVVDMVMGGNVHVFGLDASDWGSDLTEQRFLFNFRDVQHAHGVCTANLVGVRGELKNDLAGFVYSGWGKGVINMDGCDMSSQAFTRNYGPMIHVDYGNVTGALVNIRGCNMVGKIKVSWQPSDWKASHAITVRDTFWTYEDGPSDIVVYDGSKSGGNYYNLPPVIFDNVKPINTNDPRSVEGAIVWDATMGYRGDLVQTSHKRELSLRSVYGVPFADVLKVALPKGAMITGIRLLIPEGSTADTGTGTWTVTDGLGNPISAISSPGRLSYGANVSIFHKPILLDTDAKRTITVTPSGATQNNSKAMLVIEGQW